MPVGAALGAIGTIGGALISAGAQKSAARQAAQAQQSATDAQLQLGQQSLGLNRDIYNSNYALLNPFVTRGNAAGDAINALLGLPSAPAAVSPAATPAAGSGTQTAPVFAQTPVPTGAFAPSSVGIINTARSAVLSPAERAARAGGEPMALPTAGPQANGDHIATGGMGALNVFADHPVSVAGIGPVGAAAMPSPTAQPASGGAPAPSGAPSAYNAFQNFADSAGMQFQQDQAAKAINNLYAAHGNVGSGAAMKAISDRAGQIALQNYFMPYVGLLGDQQGAGLSAGSAVAGVGSNFGRTAADINTQMGNAYQNNANSAASAAAVRGLAGANLGSSIGSSLGTLASSFFPANAAAPAAGSGNIVFTGGAGYTGNGFG
jgi:hypothetical protein